MKNHKREDSLKRIAKMKRAMKSELNQFALYNYLLTNANKSEYDAINVLENLDSFKPRLGDLYFNRIIVEIGQRYEDKI